MSIHDDVRAAGTPVRIRLVLLSDVLDQASDTGSLRNAVLDGALKGKYQLYWPIPIGQLAYSGPVKEAGWQRPFLNVDYRTFREAPIPRPNIKYLQIGAKEIQHFLQVYALPWMFQVPISNSEFKDGLFIPDDLSLSSGLFEVTKFSTQIYLLDPACNENGDGTYRDTRKNSVEIRFSNLYVDERTRDDLLAQFQHLSNPSLAAITAENAEDKEELSVITAQAAQASADGNPGVEDDGSQPKLEVDEDPYELKGRSDGVYILYKIAERCSLDHAFADAENADDRYQIATTIFNQLLDEMAQGSDSDNERQKKLRSLLRDTRLGLALKLISPTYVHGSGVAGKVRREEWPPAMGKALLAEPDERRQKFVTDMLAIILRGVQYWSDYDGKVADGVTKQELLKQWLEDHGVTGVGELTTAFTLIAWNGNGSIPTPPKSAAR
jgi:hypothetical protein